ncbi:accessory gene regulator B family protein [Lacrimispora sp. 38-1]|uniref:accessory gene regulator B family protein n=1 Tax=Lacrimispora sp. 38-1 TaxID=3125778 RepID=UPI003CEB3C8D
MERLSIAFTNYILKKEVISKEDYEIYLYGFQSFLELFLNLICSLCIAVFLHMEVECLLFFLLFIPLRSFNGGLHLKSYYSCLIFSCATMTVILLIVKYYSLKAPVSFLLYFVFMVLIKLTGAVDHPNRPVDTDENQTFTHKTDRTLFISFLAALGFLFLNLENYIFLEALIYLLVFSTLILSKLTGMNTRRKE